MNENSNLIEDLALEIYYFFIAEEFYDSSNEYSSPPICPLCRGSKNYIVLTDEEIIEAHDLAIYKLFEDDFRSLADYNQNVLVCPYDWRKRKCSR